MEFLRSLFNKKKKSNQSTFCYCTKCDNELIGSGSFVEDAELVKYQCVECGTITEWLFDAPAPISLYVDGERYIHKPSDHTTY